MLVLVCDGCHCPGTDESLTKVGHLNPAFYCAECLPHWQAFEAEVQAAHTAAVALFQDARATALAALRGKVKVVADA